MSEIRKIEVVGAGTMGHGIAQVAAQTGFDVTLVDVAPAALERGRAAIGKSWDKLLSKGKLSEADRDASAARLSTSGRIGDLAG